MLARLVVSAGAVLTLVACHGGDPVMPASGGPYELASLDQVCDGSLSARDVLDRVEPEYLATLAYHDRPGTTPLRIRVEYEGGELTCMPHRDAPPGTRMASLPTSVSAPRPQAGARLRDPRNRARLDLSQARGVARMSWIGQFVHSGLDAGLAVAYTHHAVAAASRAHASTRFTERLNPPLDGECPLAFRGG